MAKGKAPSGSSASKTTAEASGTLSAQTRIAIIVSKDLFLRTRTTLELRAMLRAAHGSGPDDAGAVDEFRYEGNPTRVAEVLDECRSFGLMSSFKLVVVDEAEAMLNELTRPLIERYVQQPCEQACLVLRASSWKPDNVQKFVKQLGPAGAIIKEEAEDAAAIKWCGTFAKEQRATLEPGVAERLVERIGPDLGRLRCEVGKLAVAAVAMGGDAAKPRVTMALVEELAGLTREEDTWQFQAALLSGGPAGALEYLRTVLDRSAKDQAIVLGITMMDLAKKLFHYTAAATEGADHAGALRAAGVWGEVRAALDRARPGLTVAEAAALMDKAVATDIAMKSGLGRQDRVLERLALRFTDAVG